MRFECGDSRLNRVGYALHEAMVRQQSVCLRQLGGNRAGQVRYGRLLHNERVTVQKLIDGVCAGIGERTAGRHVLLIEDTSELNYQSHAGRVQGLGTAGNGKDAGMFIHPVLCVDADDGSCLGLAHLHLWQRTHKKAPNYRSLPIEDKESVRWINAIEHARHRLGQATHMTVIADRESDIYEMWDRLPDERTSLLIRACRDRRIETEGTDNGHSLYEWLAHLPAQGRYTLELPARTGGRAARVAQLQVRFGTTRIARPLHCSDKTAAPDIALWAIEVREEGYTATSTHDQPILWRLLSTQPIDSLEQAQEKITQYGQRWHIEQTFRTLKTQGLDVESSMVEHAQRLEKLVVLATSAAVHTMQLTLARQGNNQRPVSDCFDEPRQQLLEQLGPTLEGKTAKQKNPHPKASLAWAAWIVARLGGWNGYASERPPGPITMHNGLKALENIQRGWMIGRGAR
jgi:hypothetical protein